MLSASAPPTAIATAIDLLKQSHLSQAQQQLIEHTVTTIAQQHRWNRYRSANVSVTKAF